MILEILVGLAFIGIFPLAFIIARSIYVGDWKHSSIDPSWDPSKSRGRIRK